MKLVHVGVGSWGMDWERSALPWVSEVERVAIVESHPETLATAQRQLRLSDDQCYTDLSAAMTVHQPDIVLVTTPLAGHVPLAIEALEAGAHVLVEKPFAESVAQGQQAIAAAERAGRMLMVSQNYRFYPGPRTARKVAQSGDLGASGAVHVDFRRWDNDAAAGENHHYLFPDPLLADMAIHHWDLMRMILDSDATEVFVRTHSPSWSKFTEEAEATAIVSFANGQTVSYRGSWVTSDEPTDWAGEWRHEFADGELYWASRGDAPPGKRVTDRVSVRSRGERMRTVPLVDQPLLGRSAGLAHFVECIRTGTEPETSGRRNLGTLALMDAAIRSAASGRVEPVEQT